MFYLFSGHFLNLGWKRGAPGDTWRARRVPGRSLGAGLSGRGHSESSGRGSRGTAHSESSREGFSGLGPLVTRGGLGSIRGVLPARYSGTRVVLAGLSDVVYGLGTRGQVAFSATSGGSLSRGTRGQMSHSEASGEVLLAGLATHSGASGRLAAHSELPGRCHSRGSRRTRALPAGWHG